jgi:hypothetical protein
MRRAAFPACSVLLAFSIALTSVAVGADAEQESVEALVRTRYHEGLPFESAQFLSSAQVERLAQMLADPAEREHHANALLALGMSGRSEAYAPLAEYAAVVLAGPVDAGAYHAQLALRTALGHLAASDRRARRDLIAEVARKHPLPWSYRHLDGARLREIMRNSAASALAISGHPASLAELRRLREKSESDPAASETWRRHLQASEELGKRVEREGRTRVLSGIGDGRPR